MQFLYGLAWKIKFAGIFAARILVGLLLTPGRCHFAQRYISSGGVIAFVLALPNILWPAPHYWPTYELPSNISHSNKNVALSPAQFIAQQAAFMNPRTLPLWLAGLFWRLVHVMAHATASSAAHKELVVNVGLNRG
jgi:hypothetical protein